MSFFRFKRSRSSKRPEVEHPGAAGWFPARHVRLLLHEWSLLGYPLRFTLSCLGQETRHWTITSLHTGEENGVAYLSTDSGRVDLPLCEMIAVRKTDPELSPLARCVHLYYHDGTHAGILSPVDESTLGIWNCLLSGCFNARSV